MGSDDNEQDAASNNSVSDKVSTNNVETDAIDADASAASSRPTRMMVTSLIDIASPKTLVPSHVNLLIKMAKNISAETTNAWMHADLRQDVDRQDHHIRCGGQRHHLTKTESS